MPSQAVVSPRNQRGAPRSVGGASLRACASRREQAGLFRAQCETALIFYLTGIRCGYGIFL